MKICLIRHGSRDIISGSDGSLNANGREQAASLVARLQPQGNLLKPTQLFASPKKRAKETLTPMSEKLQLPLQIVSVLDERSAEETSVQFRSRVRQFLDSLPQKYKPNDVLYLCTHADWLEEAMIVMPTDLHEEITERSFSVSELRAFEFEDGLWIFLKSECG